MLGVRFGAVCTIVVGGMLAASAAHAVQACDPRSPRSCKAAAAQSSRESPKLTRAPRNAPATRTRHATRHRHAVRHAQSAPPARHTADPVAPAVTPPAQQPSPAARRFSEFVSPRLLAANPIEELHKPRMNVAEFSGQTAYPLAEGMDREPSRAIAAAEPAASPAPANAAAVTKAVAAVEPARPEPPTPAANRTEANAQVSAEQVLGRSGERDSPEGSGSWVRIAFLTWGGLLTLGSALRLLIG